MSRADEPEDRKVLKESDDTHDRIVRQELDAAVNSLKKRIENLKGVNVSIPKKPNPFRDDARKSR